MSVSLRLEGNCRFEAVETDDDTMLFSSRTRRVPVEISGEYIVVRTQPISGVPQKRVKRDD